MPNVGDSLLFAWQFQKGGVNTIPSSPPTGILIAPGGSATPFTPTAIDAVNVPGAYEYTIANAVQGTYLAWANTTDLTADEPDIPNGITVDAASGSSPATIAAAVWAYVIASTLSAGNTLSAIYQKTLASPIQFINPFIAVNKQLGPIVCGDAYTTANNRQIDMPVPGNVPISSCTLKLPNEDGTEQTITGTPVQISSQWYARYELTSAQTTPLAISSAGQTVSYGAKAVATADSTILTVQQGNLVVVRSL